MSEKTFFDRFLEEHGDSDEYVIESYILSVIAEIRRYMREEGITQKQISKAMGVSQSHISKLLVCDHSMTLKSLALLGKAMGARWSNPSLEKRA